MKIWQKIFTGDGKRKSRFHDETNNLISLAGLFYGPRAFKDSVIRVVTGQRPNLPWISYRAIKELEQLIQPNWKILEFGSGLSTLWLAERCSFIHSIEHDEYWYNTVDGLIKAKNLTNVKYENRIIVDPKNPSIYTDLSNNHERFNLILVDGAFRAECLQSALSKLEPKGYIYLDNSDRFSKAKKILLEACKNKQENIKCFIDFPVALCCVTQGMLVQLD